MSSREANGRDFEVLRAPEVPRRLQFWPHQWFGLPFLFAIPVLALSGFLGETSKPVHVVSPSLEIAGEYPNRLHYGKSERIELTITNRSDRTLRAIELDFDDAYLNAFSDLNFTPSVDAGYRARIEKLDPGESRTVRVGLRGEKYGRAAGRLEARIDGKSAATLELASFVFP